MPLKHLPSEENPVSSGKATEKETAPVAASALELDSKRYDTEKVRQILALAETKQTAHRTTLSAKEIEELGGELAVEPEFVRQALSEMKDTPATKGGSVSSKARTANPRVSTRQTIRAAAIAPLIYLMLALVTSRWVWVEPFSVHYYWFYVYVPLAFAFCKGFTRNHKRMGLVDGIFFGFASFITSILPIWHVHFTNELEAIMHLFLLPTLCVAGAGIFGSLVGQEWRKLFSTKNQTPAA